VLIAAAVLGLTSMAMNDAAAKIDIVSYGLIALLGLWLVARKLFGWGHLHWPRKDKHHLARRHLQMPHGHVARHSGEHDAHGRLPDDPHYGHDHGDEDEHDHHHHDHAHVVTPQQVRGNWLEQLGVVAAVGLRPCSGALIVLALALADGVVLAGIAAVFAMGLGTAVTTGVLAALAVSAKGLAGRIAGLDNRVTNALLWWAELLAATVVFGFGLTLVLASL
jgi:ABC-type nickel/cobalt efflux system permease component RcnA